MLGATALVCTTPFLVYKLYQHNSFQVADPYTLLHVEFYLEMRSLHQTVSITSQGCQL